MHPDYLLDALTSKQISEWEAYDRLDPIGTWREDFRMAFLATMITNLTISVHGKKGTKQVDLKDFMPVWDIDAPKNVKVQDADTMKQILLEIANSQNKKVEKGKTINKKKQ